MISKVIIGKTFSGACKYICKDQRRAVVLDAEGVRSYDRKLMSEDFERQHTLRPSLHKVVFHGILSFYPGEKIEDEKMIEIAREYLQKMNVADTQFSITKHIDKNHSHLHIIANLVNNKSETIKDNWIGLRGKKIAQELTTKYGLKEAISKDLSVTHLEQLHEKEANRYIIYQAILEMIPQSRSLDNLKEKLAVKNIETLYKYKGQTKELQGISFRIGNFKYKGSEIDRKFSVKNLEKAICRQKLNTSLKPSTASSNLNQNTKENIDAENKKSLGKDANILLPVINPQENNQPLPYQWRMSKKSRNKKSNRLHS
ncbi:MAG: relaxase/mobilization nuclease domain-containing protein [Ginsengibacter sp.]